jgi:hypothetical protein
VWLFPISVDCVPPWTELRKGGEDMEAEVPFLAPNSERRCVSWQQEEALYKFFIYILSLLVQDLGLPGPMVSSLPLDHVFLFLL